MILFNTSIYSPVLIVVTILFALTSSITTFEKRLIQAKRSGDLPADEPLLPTWTIIFYWLHFGVILALLLLNPRYAVLLFVVGFILAVLPVWEIIGNILMSPFKPKRN